MRKKLFLINALVLLAAGAAQAGSVVYNQNIAATDALAVNTNFSFDTGSSQLRSSNADRLSAQAVYAQGAPATVPFTDGKASTATITVSSMTALRGQRGTNTLTVAKSTTVLASLVPTVSFTLNGITMYAGDRWNIGASTGATGQNITNAINSFSALNGTFLATTSSTTVPGVVNITCIATGAICNSYTLTSSSQAALSAGSANFTGGVNPGLLIFNLTSISTNTVTLTEGIDYQAVTSSQATATSIKSAIDGNSVLSALVSVSTATGGKANLTSKATGDGYNFGIITSSPAALAVTNGRMYGATNSSVTITNSSIYAPGHDVTLGLAMLYTAPAGTSPGLLVPGTTYYGIPVDTNYFQVASSTTNAVAGTKISITTQTATGAGSFLFTPIAYSGTASFKWQISNDSTNWADLSVSSVTYSSPSTTPSTTFWDFGAIGYRYIRLNVIAPTRGGLYLYVPLMGRSDD